MGSSTGPPTFSSALRYMKHRALWKKNAVEKTLTSERKTAPLGEEAFYSDTLRDERERAFRCPSRRERGRARKREKALFDIE